MFGFHCIDFTDFDFQTTDCRVFSNAVWEIFRKKVMREKERFSKIEEEIKDGRNKRRISQKG